MNASIVSWTVSRGLLLLVVVLNEVLAMSSNGSSVQRPMCLQQFYTHSETPSLSTVVRKISIHEDEHHAAYELSGLLPRHQEEQDWFPHGTSERNRLQFTTTQTTYETPNNNIGVLSYARLNFRSTVRSRLYSKMADLKKKYRNRFIFSLERKVTDFEKKSRNEVRDSFERSNARRESRSQDRSSLDKRMTRFKRESKYQVRDDLYLRWDSRREDWSNLYRRMADLKREFRFQGRNGFRRSDLLKESRSESRRSLDQGMADVKRYSRHIVRDGFEISHARGKSRSEGGSILGIKMSNIKNKSRNQVKDGFHLKNETKNEGKRCLDRRMADLNKGFRNQVEDGLVRSALRSKFRYKSRSSLDRRMADLKKDFRFQVRDDFGRPDLRKESRGEGRSRLDGRMAYLHRDSRNQVIGSFERSDLNRKSRSEGRSIFGRRMANLKKASRDVARDGSERSDPRKEVKHEGRNRLEKIMPALVRTLKRGSLIKFRSKVKGNPIIKVAESSRHRRHFLNRTERISLGSCKGCIHEVGLSVVSPQILISRTGKTSRRKASGSNSPKRLTIGGAGDKVAKRSMRRVSDIESHQRITLGSVKKEACFLGRERWICKSTGIRRRVNYPGPQSHKNFKDSERATVVSSTESGIIVNAVHLKFPLIQNPDMQDMSFGSYLQTDQTNYRAEHGVQALEKVSNLNNRQSSTPPSTSL